MMTLEDGRKKTAIKKKSFLETDATYMPEDSELSDEMDKHADAFQDCEEEREVSQEMHESQPSSHSQLKNKVGSTAGLRTLSVE